MVIMFRFTESPIVFIQQLGRGLLTSITEDLDETNRSSSSSNQA